MNEIVLRCLTPPALIPEFDVEVSDIRIYLSDDGARFVKTVHPKGMSSVLTSQRAYDSTGSLMFVDAGRVRAEELWLAKFGTPMPWEIDFSWAADTLAWAIPYDGPTKLSAEEWSLVQADCGATLDMLWLVVEGLGWRPGRPVSEGDAQWRFVVAREAIRGIGYAVIVRALLAMPKLGAEKEASWMRLLADADLN